MEAIRTALASFGLSGRVFHAPCLTDNPEYEIVAVLERHAKRSLALFPRATIHGSFDALLADPRIELVIVNTPDHLHAEMCREALLARKHVVVEKPMVPTATEAAGLFELAEQQNRVLTVYQNRRYDGDFIALQRLLASGALGRLFEYEARIELWRPVETDAWREREDAGGIVTNLGAHLVDQAVLLFGAPTWVLASLHSVRPGTCICDSMLLELGYDGPVVRLIASYAALEPGPRFTVRGAGGSWTKWGFDRQEAELKAAAGVRTVLAGDREFALIRRVEGQTDLGNSVIRNNVSDHEEMAVPPGDYRLYYEQLYRAIRLDADPPVGSAEAVLTVKILQAAIASNAEGRRLSVTDGAPTGE